MSFARDGKPSGILVDLISEITVRNKVAINVDFASHTRIHQLMLNSKADITIVHNLFNLRREKAIYLPYTRPLHLSLYAMEGGQFLKQDTPDLKHASIGNLSGLPQLLGPKGTLLQLGSDFSGEIHRYRSHDHQVKALKAGRVDLIPLFEGTELYWQQKMNIQLRKVKRFATSRITVWFNGKTLGENAQNLCELTAQELDRMAQSTEMELIFKKYQYDSGVRLFLSGEPDEPYNCITSFN